LIRALIIDDFPLWREFVCSKLAALPGVEVIGQASDGLEAVQKTKELQPDLILLDIGLPTLNGIEVARRIREVSPRSKVLFVTATRSSDIAEEALRAGAGGYVVKSDATGELLAAVAAVLQDKPFLSVGVIGHNSGGMNNLSTAITHCHEVAFYADDASVVDGYARFIESALKSGNAVIVVVTELHRASLISRLEADSVDVAANLEQGRYIPLDAADALSRLTINDMLDPVLCTKVIGGLFVRAAKSVAGKYTRVLACGEISRTLLSKGNAEGAIEFEHLWDEITRGYGVHTLCGYSWSALPGGENSSIFNRICAEHTAVHGAGTG